MSAQTPQTDDPMLYLEASRRAEIVHIAKIAQLLQERDRLKALCEELREALQETVDEVSWFVSRKKDLSAKTDEAGRLWAEVLDEDLNIARAALKKAQKP